MTLQTYSRSTGALSALISAYDPSAAGASKPGERGGRSSRGGDASVASTSRGATDAQRASPSQQQQMASTSGGAAMGSGGGFPASNQASVIVLARYLIYIHPSIYRILICSIIQHIKILDRVVVSRSSSAHSPSSSKRLTGGSSSGFPPIAGHPGQR